MRPALGIAALALVTCLPLTRARAQVRTATAPAAKTATCQIEGVWGLVSVTEDGQDRPLRGFRERKIVARGHFMWLGSDARRDTIPLRTAADSLRARQVSGGTGTYSLAGNTYTEHLDYFVLPNLEGTDFPATCRTEGDRWYHSYPMNAASGMATSGPQRMKTEAWRRIR